MSGSFVTAGKKFLAGSAAKRFRSVRCSVCAGIIEIVLGLLITIGLLTSYAAFIADICVFD